MNMEGIEMTRDEEIFRDGFSAGYVAGIDIHPDFKKQYEDEESNDYMMAIAVIDEMTLVNGMVRVSNEEFRYVEYLHPKPDLLRMIGYGNQNRDQEKGE